MSDSENCLKAALSETSTDERTAPEIWYDNATDPENPICQWITAHGGQVVKGDNGMIYEVYDRSKFMTWNTSATMPDYFKGRSRIDFSAGAYTGNNVRIGERAKLIAERYIDNYDSICADKGGVGLYLHSKARGSGKTLLATIIGAELYKRGTRAVFWSMANLLDELKSTFDKESRTSTSSVIEPCMTAALLILDDIGVEKQSAWVNETLYKIVDRRLINKRPTIFTSNIPIDELQYDERITDRIRRMTYDVQMPEESVRAKMARAANAGLAEILEG